MTTPTRGRVRVERSAKRVRTFLGGKPIADSTHALLVWESPHYPSYYFPVADVRMDLLIPDGTVEHSPSRGDGQLFTISAGGREAIAAAKRYAESPIEELRDAVRFEWDAMDGWFEEDEEVFVHARDPYTRIDILASSRHVCVEVDGVTVADSHAPRLLFETGLPVRYYLPKTHVRMDLLVHTDTSTHCPYKGTAEYWSVKLGDAVHADLAWSYRTPLPESQKIAGLISFYDEKVDVFVDGVRQERPRYTRRRATSLQVTGPRPLAELCPFPITLWSFFR